MKKTLIIVVIIVLVAIALVVGLAIYKANLIHKAPTGNKLDFKNATYLIDGQALILKDGVSITTTGSGSSAQTTTRYFGNEASGDINRDGQADVAFILTQDTGGSGTFYYLAVALASDQGAKGLNAILLGDRINPLTTGIIAETILVNYDDRKATEPMNVAPSVGVSKYFQVIDNQLVEMPPVANMANPASVNCLELGGNLVSQTRGDGGEYNLCYFEDNRACEEWALSRGDCPRGGVKTTGFDTVAQKYCAWSGGETLAVPQAVCTFKNGSKCSVDEFYNGTCVNAPNCQLENCHGLDIKCGANPPAACTEVYTLGDKCLLYAQCNVQNGVCQQIENSQFTQCKACVQKCADINKNDNIKMFECESKCD